MLGANLCCKERNDIQVNKLAKIVILILISWGLVVKLAFIFSFEKKYPEEAELNSVVEIVSMKKKSEKSSSYTVKLLKSNLDKTVGTKIILYTNKDSNLKYGDIIQISGKFSKGEVSRNYKGFNYRNYLKQNKIYGTIYSKQVTKIGHKDSILEKIFILKEKLYNVLDSCYTNQNYNAFLKGILLGDSSNLDEEVKDNFRDSSMSHVLAISGMHISYVILGIQYILNKVVNSRKLKNYILIIVLIFFAIITGMSQSCIRACIMSGMLFISQNFYRKNNFYVSIFFTFLILLFINPYNIFAVGMWLSFGGTLGIVLFHNFLLRFLECKFTRCCKRKIRRTFLLQNKI